MHQEIQYGGRRSEGLGWSSKEMAHGGSGTIGTVQRATTSTLSPLWLAPFLLPSSSMPVLGRHLVVDAECNGRRWRRRDCYYFSLLLWSLSAAKSTCLVIYIRVFIRSKIWIQLVVCYVWGDCGDLVALICFHTILCAPNKRADSDFLLLSDLNHIMVRSSWFSPHIC